MTKERLLDLQRTVDTLQGRVQEMQWELRQAERRVIESSRVEWHAVTNAGELDVAWPILVDLHQRRRRSLGLPSHNDKARYPCG